MCLRAAPGWPAAGVGCRVVDLRWLAPLPVEDMRARGGGDRPGADRRRDPALRRGSPRDWSRPCSRRGFTGRLARVAAEDSFIPLGDAATLVLVSEDDIERAARRLLENRD